MRNRLERHGTEIAATISGKAEEAISREEIQAALLRKTDDDLFDDPRFTMDPTAVKTAAESEGDKEFDPADYEAPNESSIFLWMIFASNHKSLRGLCPKAKKRRNVLTTPWRISKTKMRSITLTATEWPLYFE
jgi:hypothetical protein